MLVLFIYCSLEKTVDESFLGKCFCHLLKFSIVSRVTCFATGLTFGLIFDAQMWMLLWRRWEDHAEVPLKLLPSTPASNDVAEGVFGRAQLCV